MVYLLSALAELLPVEPIEGRAGITPRVRKGDIRKAAVREGLLEAEEDVRGVADGERSRR